MDKSNKPLIIVGVVDGPTVVRKTFDCPYTKDELIKFQEVYLRMFSKWITIPKSMEK